MPPTHNAIDAPNPARMETNLAALLVPCLRRLAERDDRLPGHFLDSLYTQVLWPMAYRLS
jgi:hypothetical protein